MKKLLLTIVLVSLMSTPVLAVPSLGSWQEFSNGTTHQEWHFTPGSQNPVNPIQFFPESEFNPNDYGYQVFAQTLVGTYDGISAFTGNTIIVDLKINNYPSLNAYKEVWVDLGLTNGDAVATLTATDHGTLFSVVQLQGPGPSGNADFGFLVKPNPFFEDILISITGSANGAPAVLDYIHVDTICIPAPGAILLGGIGISIVGWMRRRRTL